jgi:hypothetical protein
MPYEAPFGETILMRGHKGEQIDAYMARAGSVGQPRFPPSSATKERMLASPSIA